MNMSKYPDIKNKSGEKADISLLQTKQCPPEDRLDGQVQPRVFRPTLQEDAHYGLGEKERNTTTYDATILIGNYRRTFPTHAFCPSAKRPEKYCDSRILYYLKRTNRQDNTIIVYSRGRSLSREVIFKKSSFC